MGRWDNSRICQRCNKIHDCEFYENLMKSINLQFERFNIMLEWYQSTLDKIDKEIDDASKGFPSELSDK
jgi:hypothetical protein